MLRVSKVPPGDPTTEEYVGQNRFECLTCPYHFVINKRYFERKYMKKKEVEDILGGKGAWDNVDKTLGTFVRLYLQEDKMRCRPGKALVSHKY
jgi:DNA-directed RNA polymerase III subunit RPC11